jgi:hypothetical protein
MEYWSIGISERILFPSFLSDDFIHEYPVNGIREKWEMELNSFYFITPVLHHSIAPANRWKSC